MNVETGIKGYEYQSASLSLCESQFSELQQVGKRGMDVGTGSEEKIFRFSFFVFASADDGFELVIFALFC